MTKPGALLLLWAASAGLLAPSASAQLSLFTVENGVETPVGQAYNVGSVAVGAAEDVVFRIKYTGSSTTYYLTHFSLAGLGYSLAATDWKTLPAVFPAAGLDFTVHFQPPEVAVTLPATLYMYGTQGVDDTSVTLLGAGIPGLTPLLNNQALKAGQTIQCGSVQVGSSRTTKLMLVNNTQASLTVPTIPQLSSADFSLTGAALSGPTVAPGVSAELDIVFAPSAAGNRTATLTIGVLTYLLEGTGVAAPPPVLPKPSLQVTLPETASAQQGTLTISLPEPSPADAPGTVTLAFQPASGLGDDPAVMFAGGTLSAAFTVTAGASTAQFSGAPSAAFQTGTTAGTLTFTAVLGSNTVEYNVPIAPAIIGIDAAVAQRDVGCVTSEIYCTTLNVELQINGWDNTRTASQIVFRFYTASGALVSPSPITVDGTSSFQQYFAGSQLGGVFGLHALFPITGDADQVVAADVQIVNSAGQALSPKIDF